MQGGGITIGQLLIALQADTSAAEQRLGRVEGILGDMRTAVQALQAPLNSVTQSLDRMTQSSAASAQALQRIQSGTQQTVRSAQQAGREINNLGEFLERAAGRAVAFTAAFVGIRTIEAAFKAGSQVVVGYNATLENTTQSFGVMLRGIDATTGALNPLSVGIERARALTLKMQDLALASPFEFPEIQRTVSQLLRFGVSVGQVIGLTEDIQNVGAAMIAMGRGTTESMDRLAYALGQINAAGHVTGQELRQLYNAGVNIPEVFAIIAQESGKTTGEISKLQKEGKLASDVFITAFQTWAKANFGDMAALQARTFTGAVSNIKEAISIFGSQAMQPLFDRLSKGAVQLAEFLKTEQFRTWALNVNAAFDVVLDGLGGLVGGFSSTLGAVLSTVTTIGQTIYTALQWINPFARHSPSLVESVESGVERIQNAYEALGREIPAVVGDAAAALLRLREAGSQDFIDRREIEEATRALATLGPAVVSAYMAAREEINSLKEAARALTPEILAQKEVVRDLQRQYEEATRSVRDIDRQIRDFKDTLQPQKDEIRDLVNTITEWEVAQANVNQRVTDAERALQPYRDALEAAKNALSDQEMALRDTERQIRTVQSSWRDHTLALQDAKGNLADMRADLEQARDGFSDLSDAARKAGDIIKGAVSTPFAGERDLNMKILEQRARLEEAQARVNRARAQGVKTETASATKDVERLRAQLESLQSQKTLRFDLPRERLRLEADEPGHGSPEERMRQIREQMQVLGNVKPQLDGAKALVETTEDRVRQQSGVVRQMEAEERVRNRQLAGLQTQKALQENTVSLARDAVQVAQDRLDAQERLLKPLYAERDAINDQVKGLNAQRQVLELQLRLASIPLEALEQEREARERIAQDINEDLTEQKKHFDSLKETQQALVQAASQWQQELQGVVREADQLRREQEAAAKKAAGTDDTQPGNRTAGLENLQDAIARLHEMDAKILETKAQIRGFFDEFSHIPVITGDNPIARFLHETLELLGPALVRLGALSLFFGGIWPRLSGIVVAASRAIFAAIALIPGPVKALLAASLILQEAWKNDWGGIQEKTAQVGDFIGEKLRAVGDYLRGFRAQVDAIAEVHGLDDLSAFLATLSIRINETFGPDASQLFDTFTQRAGDAFSLLGTLAQGAITFFSELGPTIAGLQEDSGLDLWNATLQGVSIQLEKTFGPEASERFDRFTSAVGDAFSGFGTILRIAQSTIEDLAARIQGFQTDSGMDLLSASLQTLSGIIGDVFGEEAATVFDQFTQQAGDALSSLGSLVRETVDGPLTDFWNFLQNNIFPTLGSLKDWIGDNVIPVLVDLSHWLKDELGARALPLFQAAVTTVRQTVGGLWSFITTYVNPVLGTLFSILGTVGQIIKEVVILAVRTLVTHMGHLADAVGPILQAALQTAGELLGAMAKAIFGEGGPGEGLLGGIQSLADWLGAKIVTAFTNFNTFLQEHVLTPLGNFLTTLQSLNTQLDNLSRRGPVTQRVNVEVSERRTDIGTAGGSAGLGTAGASVTSPGSAGGAGASISGHAEGGIVRKPELSWIGEKGPEAVIPLKNGSVPVNITRLQPDTPHQIVTYATEERADVSRTGTQRADVSTTGARADGGTRAAATLSGSAGGPWNTKDVQDASKAAVDGSMEPVRAALIDFSAGLREFTAAMREIVAQLRAIVQPVAPAATEAQQAVSEATRIINESAQSAVTTQKAQMDAIGKVDGVVTNLTKLPDIAGDIQDAVVEGIRNGLSDLDLSGDKENRKGPGVKVPGMAGGAYVDRPTLALVGEDPRAGPEFVAPDQKLRQLIREESGGGTDIDYGRMAKAIALANRELGIEMDGARVTKLVSDRQYRTAETNVAITGRFS
jgi:tape measure domain-containing protein